MKYELEARKLVSALEFLVNQNNRYSIAVVCTSSEDGPVWSVDIS